MATLPGGCKTHDAGVVRGNRDARDEDHYGRKLRIIESGGKSVGAMLVEEGLARWYGGGRRSWCG